MKIANSKPTKKNTHILRSNSPLNTKPLPSFVSGGEREEWLAQESLQIQYTLSQRLTEMMLIATVITTSPSLVSRQFSRLIKSIHSLAPPHFQLD